MRNNRINRILPQAIRVILIGLSLTVIAAVSGKSAPDLIPLPNGFQPEGIAAGAGATIYVGSIPTGAVYQADIRTGQGKILVPPQTGHASVGMKFDKRTNLLFVAGGPTGKAFVYDARTGANVDAITLTTNPATFINDVIVTKDAAYFTESFQPVLYRVRLGNGGVLPNPAVAEAITLGGDYQNVASGFNANGIAATPNGKQLIIVNSSLGTLYLVDPQTGNAVLIDLNGGSVPFGDGILLQGHTLYVVQNSLNQIAVVQLNPQLTSGEIVRNDTNASFHVPTTITRFGNTLYAVNAKFDIPPTPDTPYEVVRVAQP
jgi:sugar lactone lactonase YvrE